MIIDTDSFADVMMIAAGDATYCFEGATPKAVPLQGSVYSPGYGFTEEGPACVYSVDGKLIKAVYANGQVTCTVFSDDEISRTGITAGETVDELFYQTYEKTNDERYYTHYLYYQKIGQEPVRIADMGKDSYGDLRWDNHTKKCYYISGNILFRCDRDGSNTEAVFGGCKSFSYEFDDYEPVAFEDVDGYSYVVLEGNIYKK